MKKLYIFLSITLLIATACNDDVLEQPPLDKISEDAVWTDRVLTEAFVNAQYNGITHGFNRHWLSKFCDETYGDNGFLQGNMTPDQLPGGPPRFFAWINYWGTGYSFVRDINIFFEKIEETPYSEGIKDGFKGQMYFVRAYVYFNLFERYGGVPIIKSSFGLDDSFIVSRASSQETIQYISEQLDLAIDLLPRTATGSQKGRASQAAAMALKARLYLYAASPLWNESGDINKWEYARAVTEEFLTEFDGNPFVLYDDYANLFLDQETMDVPEVIFAQHFSVNKNHHGQQINTPPEYGGWGGFSGKNVPTQNLIDSYETIDGEVPYVWSGTDLTGRTLNPDNTLYDPNNPYVNRDPRFHASILYDGTTYKGRVYDPTVPGEDGVLPGLDGPEHPQSPWDKTLTGYNIRKFMNEELLVSRSIPNTNPWIHLRLAEIYLNYAEIMYNVGEEDIAREYLNRVRSRTGVEMPDVADSGTDLWNRIVNERKIELVFENHRFWDVRRWEIADITENRPMVGLRIFKMLDDSRVREPYQVLSRNFEEQHYLIAIPQSEIDVTEGALSQNPNY